MENCTLLMQNLDSEKAKSETETKKDNSDGKRASPIPAVRKITNCKLTKPNIPTKTVVVAESVPNWSGVAACELTRHLQSSDFPLPELRSTFNHTVLASLSPHGGFGPGSFVAPGQYVDVWDFDKVRLPCSSRCRISSKKGRKTSVASWEVIEENIIRNYVSVRDLVPAISTYYKGTFDDTTILGLIKTVNEDCSPQEAQLFISLLPYIASLVIELPSFCTRPIQLLKSGMNHTVTFSRQQIASLLANAFFCTLPRQTSGASQNGAGLEFPHINFDRLFTWSPQSKSEKIKCVMNYFHKNLIDKDKTGLVSFTRRSLETFPGWADSSMSMVKVHITHKGKIENADGCLQVSFSNEYVGGDVLDVGCAQQEIRFLISPELIVACLFTERLEPNECLVVTGVEFCNQYTGYGDTFRFKGSHNDNLPRDAWGRRMTQIVAINAQDFSKSPENQFQREFFLRDLNKAYVGFVRDTDPDVVINSGPPSAVATGNWGCGKFRGDPRLKFLLQWMACSEAGRPMIYFTFEDVQLQRELGAMYDYLTRKNATVGDVFRRICRYEEATQRHKLHNRNGTSLYNFMYEF